MSQFVNTYLAYRLIKLLASPFSEWKAFKVGIIDDKGEILKRPILSQEKSAFGMFEKIILNIKKAMNKLVGNTKAAAVLSTLFLLKENTDDFVYESVLGYLMEQDCDVKNYILTENLYRDKFKEV